MVRSAAGAALLATLLLVPAVTPGAPVPFANPPELVSSGGVLGGTLIAALSPVTVAGKHVSTTVYNGMYMPPLLRLQPGDSIQLQLANGSQQSTNVHYHGLAVTPLGPGDNVFLDIDPATTFQYDFTVPADHPQGLYWYHPHFHPDVNPQIAAGLSGGMIIGDILAPFPQLAGITERVMLLKDLKIRHGEPVDDPDPTGRTFRTINGLFKPRIDIAPGELQFWRIGNIGANIYYKLKLPGYVFYVIAQDGNLKNQVVPTKSS